MNRRRQSCICVLIVQPDKMRCPYTMATMINEETMDTTDVVPGCIDNLNGVQRRPPGGGLRRLSENDKGKQCNDGGSAGACSRLYAFHVE